MPTDRYQEALSPSYAKSVLGDEYNENYDYFLIISLDAFVISGVNKKDPLDITEKVYEGEMSLYDRDVNERDFVNSGGTLGEFNSYKKRGKRYLYLSIILPFLVMLVFCLVLFKMLS